MLTYAEFREQVKTKVFDGNISETEFLNTTLGPTNWYLSISLGKAESDSQGQAIRQYEGTLALQFAKSKEAKAGKAVDAEGKPVWPRPHYDVYTDDHYDYIQVSTWTTMPIVAPYAANEQKAQTNLLRFALAQWGAKVEYIEVEQPELKTAQIQQLVAASAPAQVNGHTNYIAPNPTADIPEGDRVLCTKKVTPKCLGYIQPYVAAKSGKTMDVEAQVNMTTTSWGSPACEFCNKVLFAKSMKR